MENVIKHLTSLRRKAKAELKKLDKKKGTRDWDYDSDPIWESELEGQIKAYGFAIASIKHELKVQGF